MENNSNRFEVIEILGISEEAFKEYLLACGLEDKDDYHEEDLRLLEDYQDHIIKGGLQSEYQLYLSQGITPHEAMVNTKSDYDRLLMIHKNRGKETNAKTSLFSPAF